MAKTTSEAQKRAVLKYDAKNTKQYHLKLNLKTDADIIQRLEEQESVQGYIKDLIREDISCNKAKDYGATYDYMRDDFTDGKADVCERICQALMKNGVLVISRTEHYDRVRFKWLLRGEKQKELGTNFLRKNLQKNGIGGHKNG